MKLWSTSRHLSLVCLIVSSIWLVGNQRFIRERTRRTKKFGWGSTFLRTIFSVYADLLWQSSWLCTCRNGKCSVLETGLYDKHTVFLVITSLYEVFWLDISVILMLFYYSKIKLPFIHSYASYFATLGFALVCCIIYFYNVNVQMKKEKLCLSVNCVSFCK